MMLTEEKKRLNPNEQFGNYHAKCREKNLQQNINVFDFQKVNIEDLGKATFNGLPFEVSREDVKANKEWTHLLIYGTTGTGKSNGITFDIINILARSQDKPSMVINDIKGECYTKYSKILKKLGYKVRVFNFKNSRKSHSFNPLYNIYYKAKECKILKINKQTKYYNEKYAELAELIQQFADFEVSYQARADDQTWDAGVRAMVYNFVLRLSEDVINNRPMPEELFTLSTVNQLYQYLCGNNKERCSPPSLSYFQTGDESRKGLAPIISAADRTYSSYIACYKSLLNTWTSICVLNMTNGMDLTDDVLFDGPVAIFIITREYSSSDFIIASKIFDWIYNTLSDKAEESPKKTLDRKFIFILDEFGNMPVFEMFASKISLSRSKGIFFCVILQSKAQLKQYNEVSTKSGVSNDGQTIIDNCFTTIFYGSPNPDTINTFCESCGKMTVVSVQGMKTGDNSLTEEIPCLVPEDIDNLKKGEYFVKIRGKLMKASAIMAYEIFEQNETESMAKLLPDDKKSIFDYSIDFTAKARELPKRYCQEDDRETCDKLSAELGIQLKLNPSEDDLYHKQVEERNRRINERNSAPIFTLDIVQNLLGVKEYKKTSIEEGEMVGQQDENNGNITDALEWLSKHYGEDKCRFVNTTTPRIEFYENGTKTFVFYIKILSTMIEFSDRGITWNGLPYTLKNDIKIEKTRKLCEDIASKKRVDFSNDEFKYRMHLTRAIMNPEFIALRLDKLMECIREVNKL